MSGKVAVGGISTLACLIQYHLLQTGPEHLDRSRHQRPRTDTCTHYQNREIRGCAQFRGVRKRKQGWRIKHNPLVVLFGPREKSRDARTRKQAVNVATCVAHRDIKTYAVNLI